MPTDWIHQLLYITCTFLIPVTLQSSAGSIPGFVRYLNFVRYSIFTRYLRCKSDIHIEQFPAEAQYATEVVLVRYQNSLILIDNYIADFIPKFFDISIDTRIFVDTQYLCCKSNSIQYRSPKKHTIHLSLIGKYQGYVIQTMINVQF